MSTSAGAHSFSESARGEIEPIFHLARPSLLSFVPMSYRVAWWLLVPSLSS